MQWICFCKGAEGHFWHEGPWSRRTSARDGKWATTVRASLTPLPPPQYLGVDSRGIIDLAELEAVLTREKVALVSTMLVNNEIGTLQPINEIGALAKKHGALFHTDAAQGVGKVPFDVEECRADLVSISGHKIYGPKGVGAMFLRRRPRARIESVFSGGGQERGVRPGTLPTHLCVGLGEAARLARLERDSDEAHVTALHRRLVDGIQSRIDEVRFNGDAEGGYKGCVNLAFSYVEGESMLMAISDVAVSSGSACTSASLEPSYVLRALGVRDDLAHTSLRFGIHRFSTAEEIDYTIELAVSQAKRLREMSPLYEMVQAGVDLSKIDWGTQASH